MQIRHPFFTQRTRRGGVPADVSRNNESFDERIVAFYSGCHECSSVSEYFSVFEKKKEKKKNHGYRSGKNILYLFNRYCNDVFRASFFFFPFHSFFSTFNPHYLFSFSRCLPTFPIVISARNCRERDGSIQSDFKKLMIGIFMSRKEVMHTPRKLSYTYVSTRIRFSPTTSVTWFPVFVKRRG